MASHMEKEMLGYQDDEVAAEELSNASTVLACVAAVQRGGRGKVKFEREVRGECEARSLGSKQTRLEDPHPHVEFLIIMEAVLEHPEKTLSEIARDVYTGMGSEFALASIFCFLKRNLLSLKRFLFLL